MSDAKPKRSGREVVRNELAVGEGMRPDAAPIIVAPQELSTSAIALSAAAGSASPSSEAASSDQPAAPAAAAVRESVEPAERPADNAWGVWAQMQSALARGCEEIALEMTAIGRSDIAAATDAATAMLDARTFAEALEISAGLLRRRADALIAGSARLSEIGMQAATAASRPIVAQLAAGWSGADRS